MQRALLFAHLRALQRSQGWPAEVCHRILQCRGSCWAPPGGTQPPRRGARQAVSASSGLGAAPQALTDASQPQLPLCEREASHAVPLPDLLAWREAAQRQVEAVGDSWAQAEDGPSAEDLQVCCSSIASWDCGGPCGAARPARRRRRCRRRRCRCAWWVLAAWVLAATAAQPPSPVPVPYCRQSSAGCWTTSWRRWRGRASPGSPPPGAKWSVT